MLVKRVAERNKEKFVKYDTLKNYVRILDIKTKSEYIKHLSDKREFEGLLVPYNPSTFYSKEIWEGWSIFLRDEIYKKKYKNIYYSYIDCKSEVKKYHFKSKIDYYKKILEVIKQDIKIPYDPSKVYKNEWEGWSIFLNTDNNIEQIKELVNFETALSYARGLNLKLSKQWQNINFSDLPIGMTKNPNILYKNKGWIDWYHFLGIDIKTNMSYGEVIISKYLDENNISYNYDKQLKDCIYSSKLRFDFYLPKYNICIEFDGKQHFEPIQYFGGVKEFENLKIRDDIKNKWCLVNNIKLIRFNYKQDYITIENILNKILKQNSNY